MVYDTSNNQIVRHYFFNLFYNFKYLFLFIFINIIHHINIISPLIVSILSEVISQARMNTNGGIYSGYVTYIQVLAGHILMPLSFTDCPCVVSYPMIGDLCFGCVYVKFRVWCPSTQYYARSCIVSFN